MNSQASDHASSSSMGGSGGTATVSQEFQSMHEHLQNFERNFRECFNRSLGYQIPLRDGVPEVVENLRKDLGAASDGSQIPETLDKYYPHRAWWSRDLRHATPLHWAILIADRAMVHKTLQSGKVDVNAEMGQLSKYTAMDLAICGANVDIVKNLLWHGATVNIGNGFFWKGGLRSLVKNDVIFKMIFEDLPENAVGSHDFWGHTALHYAAMEGAKHVVEYLAERNADLNLPDGKGNTALHHAAMEGAKPVVEYLLERNVDINLRDNQGRTALHHAARATSKHVVKYLVERNVHMNLCDNEGRTALHHAAMEGVKPVVKYLVKRNVDINLCDNDGRTALHHAIMKRKKYVTEYLVEHNADVDIEDVEGASPILYSIRWGLMDTFTTMLAKIAIVHIQDNNDNNALHYAVQAYDQSMGNIGIVRHLRQVHVDMNARNKAGYTPFFAAVLGGHTEVVKELLISKERIRIMEECEGKTPIQIAHDNDFEYIRRALLECDDVSRYIETLYRDRQVYVDAANAILVGAALIASVTFASWLQPPLGYTPYFGESYANSNPAPSSDDLNYVDVQHNKLIRVFWVFNCLSFYFAIATVVFGARSVLPRSRLFIKETVEKLRLNLLWTSILLACAVSFVIVAFGIAGCIVLTPMLKFQWYMIGPTIFGGVVCVGSLAFLFKSMLQDVLRKNSGRRNIRWFGKVI